MKILKYEFLLYRQWYLICNVNILSERMLKCCFDMVYQHILIFLVKL